MNERIVKFVKNANYSQRDYEALLSIYKFRCLSSEQIYHIHYSLSKLKTREVDSGYMRHKMSQFKKDKLIKKIDNVGSDCPPLFTLTNDGIKVIKEYFHLTPDDMNSDEPSLNYELKSSELNIKPVFAYHQFYLNNFVINMMKFCDNIEGVKYIDERHMKKSEYVRPDGLLIIPETTINNGGISFIIPRTEFFIEMDMGTENSKRIVDKFEKYRSYFTSSKCNTDTRSVVLFVCKDNKQTYKDCIIPDKNVQYQESSAVRKRIRNIKTSIADVMLDCIKDNVEVFVGSQTKLISTIKLLYLAEYQDVANMLPNIKRSLTSYGCRNLEISDSPSLFKYTSNIEYDTYASSTQYQKSFVFINYFGEPMSAINKIMYHKQNTKLFKETFGRDLILVVVANKEDSIIALHNAFDFSMPQFNTVMFTTIKRLNLLPFNQALFKFDTYGTAVYSDDLSSFVPTNTILPANYKML